MCLILNFITKIDTDGKYRFWAFIWYHNNVAGVVICVNPVLSNIFQNDVHDIFSQDECDPVRLRDIYINSISWANDLLILSHSRKGLQTCLDDKLHAYCLKWSLVVYQTRTKTMCFSKNKWMPWKFYYGNSEIECLKEIQYLGFNITHNMIIINVITDRHKKPRKCLTCFSLH